MLAIVCGRGSGWLCIKGQTPAFAMYLNEAPFGLRVLGVLCLRICITKHTSSLTFLPPLSITIWHSDKNMEMPLWFWHPAICPCYRSFRTRPSQPSTSAHVEPGAHAFLTGHLGNVYQSQIAFQKHHWLDITGPLLATWRAWWSFSVQYLPHSFSTVLCPPLCPSRMTPGVWHHPGS